MVKVAHMITYGNYRPSAINPLIHEVLSSVQEVQIVGSDIEGARCILDSACTRSFLRMPICGIPLKYQEMGIPGLFEWGDYIIGYTFRKIVVVVPSFWLIDRGFGQAVPRDLTLWEVSLHHIRLA